VTLPEGHGVGLTSGAMDDFPTKIADLLEQSAAKIRSMTVDRAAAAVKWTAAGIVLLMLGFLGTVFLLIGIFRLLGELIGIEVTYAVFGGLFVIVGMLLWSQRIPKPED
jgi:hypothetical protein